MLWNLVNLKKNKVKDWNCFRALLLECRTCRDSIGGLRRRGRTRWMGMGSWSWLETALGSP